MALSKKKQETKEKYDRIQKLKAEGYDKRQVESITGYTNFFVNKYWSMQAEDVVKGNFDKPIYKKIQPIAAELLYINPKITKAALERGIVAHDNQKSKITKNIFIASAILVTGIGGFAIKFGDPINPTFQITSTAVAMIIGIALNFILVEKKSSKIQ